MGKSKNSTRPNTRSNPHAQVPASSLSSTNNATQTSMDPANDSGKMETASASDETPQQSSHTQQQDAVLLAIASLKAESLGRHKEIMDGIDRIKTDLVDIKERLTAAKGRISDAEDATTQLTSKVTLLETKVRGLTEKNEDLENRSRRSNLRLIGLPEKMEGKDAEAFLEKWLPDVLGDETFPSPVKIERAHRIPSGPVRSTNPAAPPRPLIMKFLNFKDKVRVMKAAQEKGRILHENKQVKFFSDFSAEVQRQRKAYDAVKQRLRAEGIQYGLQFPAKLRITHDGKNMTFETPQDVDTFLQNKNKNNRLDKV